MSNSVDVAGWTLIHFLWQGALVALAAALSLRVLRSSKPQLRYAVACAALAMMLASPIATALVLTGGAPRTPLTDSIHVLRSPQGTVLGLAVIPLPPSTAAAGSASGQPPLELRLPFEFNTDTLFSALVTLWLAGVTILLTRLAAGCWRVRRLHVAARFDAPSRWQPVAEQLADRLGLRRRFLIVDTMRVTTPTVIGWLRPIVLLPMAALSGLTPQQVEAVLAHELAHIRRHDFLINLLQTLAETILFYHPAVWWVSRRIRSEREHCCDDVAVSVCGDATEYAAALTELASWSIAHPPLAMAATRGPLLNRVRRLLRLPETERRMSRTTLAVAVVITTTAGVVALGAILKAQPIASGGAGRFGPPEINEMLGFELFPSPVRLPGEDPSGARGWTLTVGSGPILSLMGFTARGVIREAYGLGPMAVVGVPQWMDQETFDLTVPADLTIVDGHTDPEQVQSALRRYLEGTLGLMTHRETRPFPAYALVPANADGRLGPSLRASTIDCFAGGVNPRPNADPATIGPVLRQRFQTRRICGIDNNFFGLSGARVTMAELAREFHRQHYPLEPDREIVDRTGLTGAYDFELRFGALPLAAIGHANYRIGRLLEPFGLRSVFTALPEQLGLKLVASTVSHEVLVIDQINRPY
jgi:uncharacterized protein (TIGR03435 family)